MKADKLTFRKIRTAALPAAGLGLLVLFAGVLFDPQRAMPSYLIGYLFWLGISLGSYSLLMLHHLTGGKWGVGVRRFLEATIEPVPWFAVLFVPIILRAHVLFPWAYLAPTADSVVQHRAIYSNAPFFLVRAILYFGTWITLGFFLRRLSWDQDKTSDPDPTIKLRTISGPGLVWHCLIVTFATIDLVMVLERDWYSTVFPPLILSAQVLCAISLAVILLYFFRSYPGFDAFYTPHILNQLSNLLLTFVMLWTYLAFAQLLIIYAGNLPHEVTWYLHRIHGGWLWLGCLLAAGQFFAPFILLLFRSFKQAGRPLMLLAGSQLTLQLAAWLWYIAPSFRHAFRISLYDLVSVFGFGGIWILAYLTGLARAPVLAQNDPRCPVRVSPTENTLLL